MKNIDYDEPNFEELVMTAICGGCSYTINVAGWRRAVIARGLAYYVRHRQGSKWSSLMLIPFGFLTPAFWVACVRAEPEKFRLSWRREGDSLIVQFKRATLR